MLMLSLRGLTLGLRLRVKDRARVNVKIMVREMVRTRARVKVHYIEMTPLTFLLLMNLSLIVLKSQCR